MAGWPPNRQTRPRLSGAELWLLYRLVDRDYWSKRNRGRTGDSEFQMLSRVRKKLAKNLNACGGKRNHAISLKERWAW